MKRDLEKLAGDRFDLLVVGAGIHGAFVAWDATLRGLRVAIVDAGDFGGGASANSLKVIHGGLRYLQQLDLRRVRESIRERAMWLAIAPRLVRPLSFLIPTHGHGKHGPAALATALWLNDRLAAPENARLPASHRLGRGRVVGRAECLRLAPILAPLRPDGGAIWQDGQAVNTERLTLAVLRSAVERGAIAGNYARVDGLLAQGGRITGARVHDRVGNTERIVRARSVANATGSPLPLDGGVEPAGPAFPAFGLAVNLVTRPLPQSVAFGFRSLRGRDVDPVGGGRRFLFFVPWRGSCMVGTFYSPWDPDRPARVGSAEIGSILAECREACPSIDLAPEDVRFVHQGLLPLASAPGARPGPLAQHARVVDHAEAGGPAGLVSVLGVKYTTARLVAEQALDRIMHGLGMAPVPCRTGVTPLQGPEEAGAPRGTPARLHALHGSLATSILEACRAVDPQADRPLAPDTEVLRAEVHHAVRHEMAVHLTDVVLRRTDLGSERRPSDAALAASAEIAAGALGWSEPRRREELAEVARVYPS
jgi:glycerol-3-phosphate dehydrogenase